MRENWFYLTPVVFYYILLSHFIPFIFAELYSLTYKNENGNKIFAGRDIRFFFVHIREEILYIVHIKENICIYISCFNTHTHIYIPY